jgi:hypothetical protein
MNEISLRSFDDFLQVARTQDEPQQLLFVFTRNELPDGHTPEQAEEFQAGSGGHLAPAACVDKAPDEVRSFALLADEADTFIKGWSVFFVASLPGVAGNRPTPLSIDQALQSMVESVRIGHIHSFLAFDHKGVPLELATAPAGAH